MKSKASLFVSFLRVTHCRESVPEPQLPSASSGLWSQSPIFTALHSRHPITERNFRGRQPASSPKPKNSLTKIARIGLVPYQTKVTRMELLWMKCGRTFIFGSVWAALSRFPLSLKKVRLSLNRTNPPQLKGIFSKFRPLTHTCA